MTDRPRIALIATQLNDAYGMIRDIVDGLTDDEFFWEPVAGCWTVRRTERGTWAADYPELPHPSPSPLTTIAWRLVHVAESKLMYHEYAFGPGQLVWPDIDSAHTAADAIAQLEQGHQLLSSDVAGLSSDADLDVYRHTNWGEEWPTWKLLWTMVHHDFQHGGEIGTLRDLYRLRWR